MGLTEPIRAWIYRISVAAFALAFVYGLIDQDKIDEWIALILVILGGGTTTMASLFTSTKRPERPEAFDGDMDRGDSTVVTIAAVLVILALIIWIVRNI